VDDLDHVGLLNVVLEDLVLEDAHEEVEASL
jgi:hypothetical protein